MTDEEIRAEAYRKVKEKYEEVFRRSLSDKEIAEGLNEKVSELESEIESLQEQLDDAETRYREESNKPKMSERWAETIAKVESIMQIPAEEHIVRIEVGDYTGIEISFEVKGWKDDSKADD